MLGLFDVILASNPAFELSLVEHFVPIHIKSVLGHKLFNLFHRFALAYTEVDEFLRGYKTVRVSIDVAPELIDSFLVWYITVCC